MDRIKKMLLLHVPTSICNFRCMYCYIAQRPVHYQGLQADMKFSPEQVAYALRPERIGGLAYMNLCADGETLLTKNFDLYVRALVERGHYAEIVTNLTITPMLEKILSWPADLRARTEFKCSFHYLELKKHGMLDLFADNVHKIWDAGASASVEVTPHDELVPYVDELKEFSLKNFGAFPHFTIARDDRTQGIDYLTSLPMQEYDRIWGSFDSDFWRYKKSVFGVKQNKFCYAGMWTAHINLATGNAQSCYRGYPMGNVFENPDAPFPERPTGHCKLAHCYNAHALLTFGCIPGSTPTRFGDNIRNRKTTYTVGGSWLQPALLSFFNTKLEENNKLLTPSQQKYYLALNKLQDVYIKLRHAAGRVKRFIIKKIARS